LIVGVSDAVMDGAMVSLTITVRVSVDELPLASVAV